MEIIKDGGEGATVPLTTELLDGTKRTIGTANVKLVNGQLIVDAIVTDTDAAAMLTPTKDEFSIAPYSIRHERPRLQIENNRNAFIEAVERKFKKEP